MSYDTYRYQSLKPHALSYYVVLIAALVVLALGLFAAHTMDHAGHHITGMNNHVVWGLPHVFAIALIVAASGALNGATLSSVFANKLYTPYSRLSVVAAMCLLIGGLMVLVLDLGRPDRLVVAMTHYNFKSIFTWNIFLYTGFIVVGVIYLWMMMEKRFNHYVSRVGSIALVWRIVLTSGTGSIFGFLVGRNALDSAILAPLFIALSLVMGTAVFLILLTLIARWKEQPLPDALLNSLERLLIWFLLVLVYFSIVHHITNLYVAEHHGTERHVLWGPLSGYFWFGHIVIGVVIPLGLSRFYIKENTLRRQLLMATFALIGASSLIYVVVIGSQSTPQRLFPGYTVVDSSFGDAGFARYSASYWEWGLGLGGIALALVLFLVIMRIFPLVAEDNSNQRAAGVQ